MKDTLLYPFTFSFYLELDGSLMQIFNYSYIKRYDGAK